MVCGHQQATIAMIPQGESEHATQLAHHIIAPLFIPMDNDFSISVGTELMACGDQLSAQLLEVVDLAIKGNPDGFILIAHGLMPGRRKIDDREPAMLQAYPNGALQQGEILLAAVIRPAMAQFVSAFFSRR